MCRYGMYGFDVFTGFILIGPTITSAIKLCLLHLIEFHGSDFERPGCYYLLARQVLTLQSSINPSQIAGAIGY